MTEYELRKVLEKERKRQNKSRGQIANKAGLCENTVYSFEHVPEYNSTFRTAVLIADALGYVIKWELVKKVEK